MAGDPHNVMYRHEIVNLNREDARVAVTYCPLTGSALTFDRELVDDAGFGVSGLLYQANLIMYDRNTEDSLWPQMAGEAACGPKEGRVLMRRPVVEMTWAGWKELFPAPGWLGFNRRRRSSTGSTRTGSATRTRTTPTSSAFRSRATT